MNTQLILPEVNQIVRVRRDDVEGELTSRVEDSSPERILIGVPWEGDHSASIGVGEQLTIDWITPRGLVWFDGVVAEKVIVNVPALAIEMLAPPELIQRREHLRGPVTADFDVQRGGERLDAKGLTVDLSGGGLRGRIAVELDEGEEVRLIVYLPDEMPVMVEATVLRRVEPEVYVFVFREMREADRDRVVRAAFTAHRRAYAMARRVA